VPVLEGDACEASGEEEIAPDAFSGFVAYVVRLGRLWGAGGLHILGLDRVGMEWKWEG